MAKFKNILVLIVLSILMTVGVSALPDTTGFDGLTTDFTEVDEANVSRLVIEDTQYGRIEWLGTNLNVTNADFASNIIFGQNTITVNTASLPSDLNSTVRVYFYDSNIASNLTITKGSTACGSECTLQSFLTEKQIWTVDQNSKIYYQYDDNGNQINSFSYSGNNPNDLKVGYDGNLYVTRSSTNQIEKYDTSGNSLLNFTGLNNGQVVEVDYKGNVYGGDLTNEVVRAYNSTASLLWNVNLVAPIWDLDADEYGFLYSAAGFATRTDRVSKFNASSGSLILNAAVGDGLRGIAYDHLGDLYGSYTNTNNNVKKVNASDGSVIWTNGSASINIDFARDRSVIIGRGSTGSVEKRNLSNGFLIWSTSVDANSCREIVTDFETNIYAVCDDTIAKLNSDGTINWTDILGVSIDVLDVKDKQITFESTSLDSFSVNGSLPEVAPVVNQVVINSTSGNTPTALDADELFIDLLNITDDNNDPIINFTDWRIDGTSLAIYNLPIQENGVDNLKDYSTNAFTTNEFSTPSYLSTGGFDGNGAYDFNSNNDRLQVPSLYNSFKTGDVTIIMWIRPDALTGTLWQIGETQGFGMIFSGGLRPLENLKGVAPSVSGFTTGSWQQLAYVSDNDVGDYTQVYRNGVLRANISRDLASRTTSGSSLNFGNRENGQNSAFNGRIDNIMVFDRLLSQAEVQEIYNAQVGNYLPNITNTLTTGGETWQVCVTGNDGDQDGNTLCSNSININTPPLYTDVILNTTGGFNDSGDDLTAYLIGAFDGEGDPITNFTRWYVDGVYNSAYDDLLTIPTANTSIGEVWQVCATPYDGLENGTTVCSENVTLINVISSCGVSIESGGENVLINNIEDNSGSCLSATASQSNYTLNCNGYLMENNDSATFGISMSGNFNATIENCNIRNFYFGVSDTSSTYITFRNNTLFNNSFIGLSTGGAIGTNWIVEDNYVVAQGFGGIGMSYNYSVVRNNIVTGAIPHVGSNSSATYIGITAIGSLGYINITNNVVNYIVPQNSSWVGAGIGFGSVTNDTTGDYYIENNIINHVDGSAIGTGGGSIFPANDHYIINNTITNSTQGIFSLTEGDTYIIDNNVSFNDVVGVSTASGTATARSFIQNNTVTGPGLIVTPFASGISVASNTGSLVQNNVVSNMLGNSSGNATFGVGFFTSDGYRNETNIWEDNIAYDIDLGFLVVGGPTASVDNSIIRNNDLTVGGAGFFLNGDNNTLENNFVNNTGAFGTIPGLLSTFFLQGITNSVFVDNTIINPPGFFSFVSFQDSQNNTYESNTHVSGAGTYQLIDSPNPTILNEFIDGTTFTGTAIILSNSSNFNITNVTVDGSDNMAVDVTSSVGIIDSSAFTGIDETAIALAFSDLTVTNTLFDDLATLGTDIYEVTLSPLTIGNTTTTDLFIGIAGQMPTVIVSDGQIVTTSYIDGVQNYSVAIFSDGIVTGGDNVTFMVAVPTGFPISDCTSLLAVLPDPQSCSLYIADAIVVNGSGDYDFTGLTSAFNSTFNVTTGFTNPPVWDRSTDDSTIFTDGTSLLDIGTTNTFTSIGGTLILPWNSQHTGLFPQSSFYADTYDIFSLNDGTLEMNNSNARVKWGSGWTINATPRTTVILGPKFVAVNSIRNPSLDLETNISISGIDCANPVLTYTPTFETDLGSIIQNGELMSTTGAGACNNASICDNLVCVGNTLNFTSYGFSSFGMGNNSPPVVNLLSPNGTVLPPFTNTVNLVWNYSDFENDPIISYQLQIDDMNDFTTPLYDFTENNNDTSRVVSISEGVGTYFWRVRAADNATVGSYALAYNFTIQSVPIVFPEVKQDYRDQILFVLVAFSILVLIIAAIIIMSYVMGLPITTGTVLATVVVISAGFSILMTVLVIVINAI